MIDVYAGIQNARPTKLTPMGPVQKIENFDPMDASKTEMATVNAAYETSFDDYGDAAIVVVGRPSGESNDYGRGG